MLTILVACGRSDLAIPDDFAALDVSLGTPLTEPQLRLVKESLGTLDFEPYYVVYPEHTYPQPWVLSINESNAPFCIRHNIDETDLPFEAVRQGAVEKWGNPAEEYSVDLSRDGTLAPVYMKHMSRWMTEHLCSGCSGDGDAITPDGVRRFMVWTGKDRVVFVQYNRTQASMWRRGQERPDATSDYSVAYCSRSAAPTGVAFEAEKVKF